jgi:hypothetical protein
MPGINPTALKDAFMFECENLWTTESPAIYSKESGFAIIDDKILKLRGVHSEPPSFEW